MKATIIICFISIIGLIIGVNVMNSSTQAPTVESEVQNTDVPH